MTYISGYLTSVTFGHGSVLDVQNSDGDGLNSDSSKTDDQILASIFPAA